MVKVIPSFSAFELSPTLAANEMVSARRAAGQKVLHMGFGESPFPVPPMLKSALQNNAHLKHYLPAAGLPELRDAIAAYYQDKAELDMTQYDVIIAPGSKLILYALQMSVEGDLIMPVPSWVSYDPQAKMLRGEVIKLTTKLDDGGYHIDVDVLADLVEKARAAGKNPTKIILNYPNNPTGLSIPDEELQKIAQYCVREDIMIISDEIYGFVAFDDIYRTIARYAPSHTVITSGLSKHLSLGGWRIGIGLVPKKIDGLFKMLCTISSETWSCVPAPVQAATVEAYKNHQDVEDHILACRKIHGFINTYIAKKLRGMDVENAAPQGAFYNYPNFEAYRERLSKAEIHTSKDLAERLIQDCGVVALPGCAFGAEDHVLTLRLAGCDYNGEVALEAFTSGEALNQKFLMRYTPNIIESITSIAGFLGSLPQ